MSTIDYDPLDEEEAFTATSLNAGFAEVEAGINALGMDAAKRYALLSDHQPSLTPAVEHPGITWTKELTTSPVTGTGTKLTSTVDTPVTAGGDDLEVLFPSGIILGMSEASGATDRIGALLVLANVRIGGMFSISLETKNNLVVLTIAIQGLAGVWYDVPRTRRSLSQPDEAELTYTSDGAGAADTYVAESFKESVNFDIPLRSLISLGDLPSGETTIYGVKINIRGSQANTGLPVGGSWVTSLDTGSSLSAYYSVAQANLSVIPFHALAVMS
tara:strand:+ start:705 stop:1523 length:819 start_codon:yes stop_codon:yes gene_type:complete